MASTERQQNNTHLIIYQHFLKIEINLFRE